MLLAAALFAGCGARPEWPADADERTWTVPLVMAWRPGRVLIEVRIDGVGPMLMALDTTRSIGSLRPDVAERLGLPRVGDPTRGARVVAERLALGELTLRRVPLAVEPENHGALFGRPIVGLLGTDWFAGRRLRYDPRGGVLRVVPRDVPCPAEATVALDRSGPGWRVPIELAGVGFSPTLATNTPSGALGPTVARDVAAAVADGDPSAPVVIAGLHARPGPWRLADGAGDGLLSLTDLDGLAWCLDAASDELTIWRSPAGPERFARFGALPDCGPRFERCLAGRIASVERGRVALAFDSPTARLPERYWMRIDLGRPGRPYWALVQLRARPKGAPGELTAAIEDEALGPGRIRPVGESVDVVDLVPVDRACSGVICLHRQEGDAAELIMESSEPAAERSPDGVAPSAGRASSAVDPGVGRVHR